MFLLLLQELIQHFAEFLFLDDALHTKELFAAAIENDRHRQLAAEAERIDEIARQVHAQLESIGTPTADTNIVRGETSPARNRVVPMRASAYGGRRSPYRSKSPSCWSGGVVFRVVSPAAAQACIMTTRQARQHDLRAGKDISVPTKRIEVAPLFTSIDSQTKPVPKPGG